MDNLETTASLIQKATRLGLLNEVQVRDVLEEAGSANPEISEFMRICERKGFLTQWQSGKLVRGDTDGFFLGGFRLLYRIGSGSFGRVYRADDPATGRIVAIKVLRRRHTEGEGSKEKIELFYREGKMGMTLKHPHIVEILAVGQDATSRQYYIVMEFVEGGNLRDMQTIREKFTVSEALRITEEITSALVSAYAHGVTHRDMKMTNVLLSSQKTAKLVDFGLAQFYSSMGGKELDKVDRTVDYAGLEKATDVKTGDTRSDIYFLGCVLYELLTGRSPLTMTRNARARMDKQRFDSVVPLRPDELAAPPSVFMLVETMMSLDASRRYQTPSQLLEAVRNARRDVDGKSTSGPVQANKSVFVIETDERWQDAFRGKFKESGYRVLISADPGRAADRFRQQPYDALIVDIANVGEDGLAVFETVMLEAHRKSLPCAGIVILSQEQIELRATIRPRPTTAVLILPVSMKQLKRKLAELLS
jgi:eukaryotic-like serine/threonine-protein kinase